MKIYLRFAKAEENKLVYLDYAATTPVKKEVFSAMEPYFKANFGNPSSIHSWGQSARKGVEESRNIIANFLNCKQDEVIFTGCGSESDNLAIKGLIEANVSKKPHIITSQIEHHAVLKTCEDLEKRGAVEVTYLKPNREGIIGTEKIQKAIKSNTVLVSIMYVNNETGVIQPIREIGKMIERMNEFRIQNSELKNSRIFFHTDAVQATEYLPMNVDYLHVDMLTIAGHKIGTPKGIGVLYVKKSIPILPILHGGEQELGLRAGTENVPYIIGLAKAIEIIQKSKIKNQNDNEKLIKLRNYFIKKITEEIPDIYLNGSKENLVPHIINLYFKNIEGEAIVLALDLEGVACSTGSACTSQSLEPSHVIMAIYNDHFRAAGSVRFSLSHFTTKKEIDWAIKKIILVVERLRKISPYTSTNLLPRINANKRKEQK